MNDRVVETRVRVRPPRGHGFVGGLRHSGATTAGPRSAGRPGRTRPPQHDQRGDLRPGVVGPAEEGRDDRARRPRRCARTPSSWGLTCPRSGCSRTRATPAPPWCGPALERLRDLVAGVGIDVVLCYSPDRLARKFAYQALLIEEFTRAGTRVEFVKGPRGDTPEDQLLVQFQGMFAEYEKAQILERYRRGKTHRAQTGSINVLSGAPFGYRYVRKNAAHRRRLRDRRARGRAGRRAVPPLRRRRRLHRRAGPLADRLRRAHPHRQAPLGPQRGLGHAAQPRLRRARGVRQDHGRARIPGPEPGRPPAGPRHPTRVQDRRPARRRVDRDPGAGDRQRGHLRPGRRSGWPTTSASPPATAKSPRCCRAWPPARPAATATTAPPPAPPTRRSTTTGAWAATTTATKAAGSAPTSPSAPTTSTPWSGTTSPPCWPTPP